MYEQLVHAAAAFQKAAGIPVKLDDNSTGPLLTQIEAIDIAGHGRVTNVFADTRARRGETVGLRLDAAGCHLFPAPPAAAERAPGSAAPAASQAPVATAPMEH